MASEIPEGDLRQETFQTFSGNKKPALERGAVEPFQTAQEVCRLLDKAWKSFYALKRSGGIETPRPPRFKQKSIPITYMQMGIVHERDTGRVRLSLPKALKKYMEETYQIHENFLYLENKIFRGMDQTKQLRIYPPEKGNCKIIVVYEVPDQEELPQNGHELSIDLGLHNLMTCYDSENGKTFILGRKYLELERYFHKEIARVQAQWYGQQSGKGVKHPVTSKHIRKLYKRKQDSVTDYLHKITRYLAEYCREQGISGTSGEKKTWDTGQTRSFTACRITGSTSCWNIS